MSQLTAFETAEAILEVPRSFEIWLKTCTGQQNDEYYEQAWRCYLDQLVFGLLCGMTVSTLAVMEPQHLYLDERCLGEDCCPTMVLHWGKSER